MMPKPQEGFCKLTGEYGQFRRAHIIPEALTRHDRPGEPLFQTGNRSRPIRRMTSWYDTKLVTSSGEDILSSYDNWAIAELRKYRLVWSGWKRNRLVAKDHILLGREGVSSHGYRIITGGDWKRLRLFFLSVLWRAAASSMPEFSEIQVAASDMATLRRMIISQDPCPSELFSIQLTQLSTRGPTHNLSPLASTKNVIAIGPVLSAPMRIFRFYFEGLVVHFHRDRTPIGSMHYMGKMNVGDDEELGVLTRTFEGSFQARNYSLLLLETLEDHPETFKRFSPRAFGIGGAKV